jgi:RNA polymerase sigma factor (sigma-70 family)
LEFEQVLETYGDSLWRLTLMYELEYNRRKDLYQEILIAIWKALPNFENRSSIKTYVFRIGHNRGITFRNRSVRTDIFKSLNVEPDSEYPGPEDRLIRNEEYVNLSRAISQLSFPLRQVIILHIEGQSNKEISDILGVSENNVAVRLFRAKKDLAETLTENKNTMHHAD